MFFFHFKIIVKTFNLTEMKKNIILARVIKWKQCRADFTPVNSSPFNRFQDSLINYPIYNHLIGLH